MYLCSAPLVTVSTAIVLVQEIAASHHIARLDVKEYWAQCSYLRSGVLFKLVITTLAASHGFGTCNVLLTIKHPFSTNNSATGWNSKSVPDNVVPNGMS